MSKVLVLVLVAVVIVGGGWYLYSQSDMDILPNTEETQNENTGTQENTTGSTGSSSGSSSSSDELAGILTRGGNYLCEFDSKDPNSVSSGTVYIQGEKIRGEFKSDVAGASVVQSDMIATGGFVYTWTSAAPTMGFKSRATSVTDLPNAISTSLGGSFTNEAGVTASWNCRAWNPDPSKFVLPSGVTFTTI